MSLLRVAHENVVNWLVISVPFSIKYTFQYWWLFHYDGYQQRQSIHVKRKVYFWICRQYRIMNISLKFVSKVILITPPTSTLQNLFPYMPFHLHEISLWYTIHNLIYNSFIYVFLSLPKFSTAHPGVSIHVNCYSEFLDIASWIFHSNLFAKLILITPPAKSGGFFRYKCCSICMRFVMVLY